MTSAEAATTPEAGPARPAKIGPDSTSVAHSYSENIKHARMNLFVLMLAQLYCLITIETTQDAALLSNSTTQKLPILETSISIETFYVLAPLMLLIVFFNFQIHLRSLWLSAMKLSRGDRDELMDLVDTYPWFITSALAKRFASRDGGGVTGAIEYGAAVLFGWFSTAIVIALMWGRFLTKHDWTITLYHVVLVALAVAGAVYFLYASSAEMTGRRLRGWRAGLRATAVLAAFSIPLGGLGYASWWLFEAQERSGCQNAYGQPCSTIFYLRERLGQAGLDPSATLDGVDVSARPESWVPRPQASAEELAAVRGADLRGEDLRYASAKGALFTRADLQSAVLRFGAFDEAWFQGARMRGADLSFSTFAGAHFDHADLAQAALNQTDASGASFIGATLVETNGADLLAADAMFKDAVAQFCRFERADFRNAGFEGARFEACEMTSTQFDGAKMSGAGLRNTRFIETSFVETDLSGADLRGATFRETAGPRARFAGADLDAATVSRALFEQARAEDVILSNARIDESSLRDAVLARADFRNAALSQVDLSGADLSNAIFFGARLEKTDLYQARLTDADLSGADFSGAENLDEAQLDSACGDALTKLPEGLSVQTCAQKAALKNLGVGQ